MLNKYNKDSLYTIIYLDYVKELKNMGVDVDNISEKTIIKWLNTHLKDIEKVYTPIKIALFNRKLNTPKGRYAPRN